MFDETREIEDLERAVRILEFPTFTERATTLIGKPIERAMSALPAPIMNKVSEYAQICLRTAFDVVVSTMDTDKRFQKANNVLHKGIVVATGAVGGFFGGFAIAAELPVSTAVMMRSIADVAREEGEELETVEAKLACISVLGMDTSKLSGADDSIHVSKYFFLRSMMAKEVTKAAEFLAANVLTEETAPIVVKLLTRITERFGIQLTEKIAAELVPVVGAVSGAGINYLFIDHFQQIARGHFIVRRLERKYGVERVKTEYQSMLEVLQHQQAYVADNEAAATSED